MISYFKYTDGESFTLNGTDYRGMINIRNNSAYTGTTFTSDSKLLTSKGTFYGECLLNKINFNFNASTILVDEIKKEGVYPRSILTEELLIRCLNTLHLNNLKLYAAGITINPQYLNLLNKSSNTLPLTYCLTSTQGSFEGYKLPTFRLPAENAVNFTGMSLLNRYSNSIFLTDKKTKRFEYFKSFRSFKGTLNASSGATLQRGLYNPSDSFTHANIYYDKYKNLVYEVNENVFSIYNFDWTSSARSVSLKDRMRLSFLNTPLSPSTNAFGRTYRCVIAYNNGSYVLEIYKVGSVELIKTFTTSYFNLLRFNQVCMRFEDDIAVITGKNERQQDVIKVFDIVELLQMDKIMIDATMEAVEEYDVFELSEFDSDIIISKNTTSDSAGYINSVTFRSLTSPKAPLVKFKITPNTLEFFNKPDNLNILTLPIETDPTPLGIRRANSNKRLLKDIKFSVTDSINTICSYSDSFDMYMDNIYDLIPDKNLPIKFKQEGSSGSSVGLLLNNMLAGIVEETLALYYSYSSKRSFEEGSITSINTRTLLVDPVVDDLIVYGNEYINAGVMNRVVEKIFNLQNKIAVAISNNV